MTARARVGLIVPSSNPTIEGFLRRVPVGALLGIDVLVTRVRVRRIAADADADAQFDLAALSSAAELLADAEVSLISWAGTSGFWLGGTREDGVLSRASAAAGVPVTSSRVAMLAALTERPGAPVGVLTPYVRDIHDRVVSAVADAVRVTASAGGGVAVEDGVVAKSGVVADRGLGIERNLDFAAIPASVIEASLRALADAGAESLAVVCTNVLGVAGGLAGAPFVVVDSVLATLWHAARLSGSCGTPYADCYREISAQLAAPGATTTSSTAGTAGTWEEPGRAAGPGGAR